MSREKFIRILCVALVTTVLSLALILVVAVMGGMTAEGSSAESDMPHFQPFFPEGSFDIGDITLDPEDFTRDPDATRDPDYTRPPEPDVTLPDWESDMDWPTPPPTLETDPDYEFPTLPDGWDTLPPEWGTLPPEWGDMVEDPDDLADLLAGMNGSLGLPPGALAAGVASNLTVMEIYAEKRDTLYLKMQSFGNYTGQGWREAQAYGAGLGTAPYVYSALYVPHALMNEITPFEGYPLVITPTMDVRVIPYYITDSGDLDQIQGSDVKAQGVYGVRYTLYYRPYSTHVYAPLAEESVARFEAAYAEFVERCYLEVDETTLEYLRLIIAKEGFDKNDPEIIQKVAAYIRNAATYNLAYDQNLDREPNVALAFLGAYKEGVCRHYATAATLLYRALGIPARYTVGFMTDVEAYGVTKVKGMDAHAWVEVYEEGFGWRYVEVTGSPAGGDPDTPPDTDPDTTPGTGDGTAPPVEPDDDPNTWGDLLAGSNGELHPSSSVPPALLGNTVFTVVSSVENPRMMLKVKSFGSYTGNRFVSAPDCDERIYETYSHTYLPSIYFIRNGYAERVLDVTSPMGTYAIPYYVSVLKPPAGLTVGDNLVTGDGRESYSFTYYTYPNDYTPRTSDIPNEALMRAFVYANYLDVDAGTAAYLEALITQMGWNGGDTAIVETVAAYLRETYRLTDDYDTTLNTEENVVLAFLRDYTAGNARHFAAAATLIYRMLGIPARYTVGYITDAPAGATVKVMGKNAYAWSEVYVDGFGWMPVDVAMRETGSDAVYEVTLKPVDMAVLYDGTTVKHSGILEGFEIYEALGYRYEAVVQGQRMNSGRTATSIKEITIYDAQGLDVTDRFRITKENGVLAVYLAELFFVGTDRQKVYDGLAFPETDVGLVSGVLPDGHSFKVVPTDVQIHVGTGYAAYEVVILYDSGSGDPVDRTEHFLIHKQYGILTVTPATLTLKAADAEKVYDGAALTADEIRLVGGSLAEGDYIDSYTVEGSQTRVGRSENRITEIVIRNREGEDVTRNYAIETIAGTLKVTSP